LKSLAAVVVDLAAYLLFISTLCVLPGTDGIDAEIPN
jgi:hypothetical protein